MILSLILEPLMFGGFLAIGLFAAFKTVQAIHDDNYHARNKWMACAVIFITLQLTVPLFMYTL